MLNGADCGEWGVRFRRELPHGLCVGIALPEPSDAAAEAALEQLHADERAHALGLPVRRRITWAGGRLALRLALESVGHNPGPILASPRGAPLLPLGTAGSVSHKAGMAVALVSLEARWEVGVDVEQVRAPRWDISRHVLRPEEREALAELDSEMRWREILVRFSAKEAVYKALDPFVRRYVSFQEVGVAPTPGGAGEIRLALRPSEGPFEAEMSWQITPDWVLTTARVRQTAQF